MTETETIQDTLRNRVIEKSINILRNHGKSNAEIKSMMEKNFAVRQEVLDDLLKGKKHL